MAYGSPAARTAERQPQRPSHASPPSTLPLGGRQLFPRYQLVALYGAPGDPALGVLGAQPLAATIERAKQQAAAYQPYTRATVMPALEIIATTASAEPTANNDYSRETDPAVLLPWIEAAEKAGVYVVLDLQPGRSDFLTQAKPYADLLRRPNVGLALDPEWRLRPDQIHLVQIGSVGATEINQTADWLASLTARHKLPQKLFLLHQFRLDMIPDRAALDLSRPELAYVVQMDGSGTQQQKLDTWRAITSGMPAGLHGGWKNFFVQDTPMASPADTMKAAPLPVYVSYQ